jgi:protein-S-isoprenylcysteine O-methyltransferase Ste14
LTWLEHRIPPPIVGLVAAGAMWAVARVAPGLQFAFEWNLALAVVIAAIGLAIDVAGLLEFRRARTTINPLRPEAASALVRSGIFRWTRNPMYLGMAIALLGWAIYLAHPLSLLGIACFIAYLNRFQIAPEERVLERRFGAEFLAFRESVRRWL